VTSFLIEKVFEQFEKHLKDVLEKHDSELKEQSSHLIESKIEINRLNEMIESLTKDLEALEDLRDKVITLEKEGIKFTWKLLLLSTAGGLGGAKFLDKIIVLLGK
jgi:predicted nuclease with TOPRIM domain